MDDFSELCNFILQPRKDTDGGPEVGLGNCNEDIACAEFSHDINPNVVLNISNIAEHPTSVTPTVYYETKDSQEGRKQMGMVYGANDSNLQHLSTQTWEESTIEGSLDTVLENANFFPCKSKKKKGTPYFVEEDIIFTKNEEPVKFILYGISRGQQIKISMRYTEDLHKESPVHPCKNHAAKGNEDFNFKVIAKNTELTEEANHPTVMVNVEEELANNQMELSIMFYCLNSCHKLYGKKLELVMTQMIGMQTAHEECFAIRCCKNVKRDRKDFLKTKSEIDVEEYGIKHSAEDVEQQPLKKVKIDPEVHREILVPRPAEPPEITTPNLQTYLVQIPESMEPVLRALAQVGGGAVNRFPSNY